MIDTKITVTTQNYYIYTVTLYTAPYHTGCNKLIMCNINYKRNFQTKYQNAFKHLNRQVGKIISQKQSGSPFQ